MHRLIVNPGTANAWEIPLAPGVISLGRSSENTVSLEHPSVADAHCRITISNAGVLLKDLGSGGTFVEENPVDETVLLPGQTIRLGEVVMRFEAGAERPPPMALLVNARCKIHPRTAARFICPRCEGTFCDLCVSTRLVEGHAASFCRACGVECTALPPPALEAPKDRSFIRELGGAFAYPLKGDGKVVLLAGTMIIWILDLVSRISGFLGVFVGLFVSIFAAIFIAGFLVCYLQRVLVSSASGEKEVPDLPDISSFDDVASPLLQFLGTVTLCFGPAILLKALAHNKVFDPADSPWFGWALPAAFLLGCIAFPMAFMAVAMFNSLGALNPLLIVPAIVKIPLEYLFVVILLVLVFVVGTLGGDWLSRIIPIPFLPTILSGFAGFYFMTVEMRMLGLLYWCRKDKLAWLN